MKFGFYYYVPLLFVIASCSQTPEYKRPDTDKILGDTYVQAQSESLAEPANTLTWWKTFNDPVINKLVEQALQNNIDLKIAAANILEFEALVRSATGSRWPEVSALASGERRFSGNEQDGNFRRIYSTNYSLGASIAWQADLFGKLRSNEKAALAAWQASETDRDALVHTVIADVIQQRTELVIANQRLLVAKEILNSRKNTLQIVERRYERGVRNSSAVDVRLARENVYSAEAEIFAQEQRVVLARHGLDVLLGKKPARILSEQDKLNELPRLNEAIVGVPALLLDRRPDLRAAEFRVIAENERIGVAIADLLPDLQIAAEGGWRDSSINDLFSSEALFAGILGELTQTLFSAGRLSAEVDVAKARLEQQAQTYANKVLQAIREVEDALIQNHKLHAQLSKVNTQVTEARAAEILSRRRYARGVENLLTVLETERRRQIAEDSLLQVRRDYWAARINLYLALGGDWLENNYDNLAYK